VAWYSRDRYRIDAAWALLGSNCGRGPIVRRATLVNTESVLNIALLDDHPAVLAGLRRLIDPEPDLTVLAAARSADDLTRRLDGRRVDVIVLDYDLARDDGLSLCRRIKGRPESPRVIIYSAYASPALSLAARAAGADGVVDKSEPVPALLAAIRSVARGETHIPSVPPDAYKAAAARLDDEDLPVLALLLDGEPVDAIAQALRADPNEVAWRRQRIVGLLRPKLRPGPVEQTPTLGRARAALSRSS
jgi:DNA-binding NarL/FixJ family response regulator